jgi:hypothetical protein
MLNAVECSTLTLKPEGFVSPVTTHLSLLTPLSRTVNPTVTFSGRMFGHRAHPRGIPWRPRTACQKTNKTLVCEPPVNPAVNVGQPKFEGCDLMAAAFQVYNQLGQPMMTSSPKV